MLCGHYGGSDYGSDLNNSKYNGLVDSGTYNVVLLWDNPKAYFNCLIYHCVWQDHHSGVGHFAMSRWSSCCALLMYIKRLLTIIQSSQAPNKSYILNDSHHYSFLLLEPTIVYHETYLWVSFAFQSWILGIRIVLIRGKINQLDIVTNRELAPNSLQRSINKCHMTWLDLVYCNLKAHIGGWRTIADENNPYVDGVQVLVIVVCLFGEFVNFFITKIVNSFLKLRFLHIIRRHICLDGRNALVHVYAYVETYRECGSNLSLTYLTRWGEHDLF